MRSIMAEANSRFSDRAILAEIEAMDDADEIEVPEPQTSEVSEVSKELGVPERLLKIPGALQLVADYYNSTALVDQPQFAIQAALAFGSIVLGRNYCTDYAKANYTSLYMICVGDTGSGKESVKDAVEDLLYEAGLDSFVGVRDYTSEGALMGKLMKRPKHVSFIDELGKKLGDDRKGQSGNKDGVYTGYLELFSKLHSIYHGTAYSQNNKTKEEAEAIDQRKVVRPALTLVGLTPPDVFYGAVSAADVSSGFLNRFLIVQSKSDPFQPQRVFLPQVKKPKAVIEWAKHYVYNADDFEDMTASVDPQEFIENAAVIPFTPKANRMLAEIEAERTELRKEFYQYGLQELFSRTREIIQRIALIVALSDESDCIKVSHLKWARDYVMFYHRQTAEAFRMNAGRSEYQKMAEALVPVIERQGKEGISQSALGRLRKEYGTKLEGDQEKVNFFLRNDWMIVKHKKSTAGRSTEVFIHPKFLTKRKRKD